eukprot:CAMPEP_0177435420 /NCGR_PEP_ID=MMETSP0369-20130122/1071_1 /TAXON_ID=447022 ORGANISM="Scrippsiella hangoei-like, Strain SHHI-4" /NCGR_SAMPLE_ID=MMETSP0369 /ASSEMBLY_ACC=CAM_ASM_000364 /LENGTH=54 /DNA_ID=CAMNT_0018906637 /DNA_START=82 /DNA_END=243 /DNA_ORIENTATION=+
MAEEVLSTLVPPARILEEPAKSANEDGKRQTLAEAATTNGEHGPRVEHALRVPD